MRGKAARSARRALGFIPCLLPMAEPGARKAKQAGTVPACHCFCGSRLLSLAERVAGLSVEGVEVFGFDEVEACLCK